MWDNLSIIVSLVALAAQLAILVASYTRTSDAAREAKKLAHDVDLKVAAVTASLGMFREEVAREYVSRDVLLEVEQRITGAINRLADRFDRVFDARQQGQP